MLGNLSSFTLYIPQVVLIAEISEAISFLNGHNLAKFRHTFFMTEIKKFEPKAIFRNAFNKALEAQQPLAEKYVARLRRVHPEKSPDQLIRYITKWYLGSVASTGAGAGASAAVPNGVVQIPVAIAELTAYTQASVFYVLSVAEVQGLHLEDIERRRLLVSSALLGGTAAQKIIEKAVGPVAKHWGKTLVAAFSRDAIKAINKVLGPRFVTITGGKMGIIVLGKQAPLMIGAGLGATLNVLFASGVVKATKMIMGPAPKDWAEIESAPKTKSVRK